MYFARTLGSRRGRGVGAAGCSVQLQVSCRRLLRLSSLILSNPVALLFVTMYSREKRPPPPGWRRRGSRGHVGVRGGRCGPPLATAELVSRIRLV